MARILSKFIVGLLALWATFIIISEFIGITVYFPFNIIERQDFPYHRMNTVRLSVFLTFIYFSFRYLFFQSEKMYPIQFLDVYIKSLVICAIFIFYSMGVELSEYRFVIFFTVVSIIIHIAARKKMRSYFN